MALAAEGFRVINYDRRGLGRPGQPWTGYDWDSLADDLADVMQATGATKDVTVIGYSTSGGEAARCMSRRNGKGVHQGRALSLGSSGHASRPGEPARQPGLRLRRHRDGHPREPGSLLPAHLPPALLRRRQPHAASNDAIEAAVDTALTAGMKPLIDMARSFSFGDFVADMPGQTAVRAAFRAGLDDLRRAGRGPCQRLAAA